MICYQRDILEVLNSFMRKLWNSILKQSVESDTPISIVRAGSAECSVIYNHKFKNIYVKNPKNFIDIQNRLSFEAGVYASDIKSLDKWCELYLDAMASADYACACTFLLNDKFNEENKIYSYLQKNNRLKVKLYYNKIYDYISGYKLDKDSWHYQLNNKKVLVISNAEQTFRHQADIYHKMWPGIKFNKFHFVKIPFDGILNGTNDNIEWDLKLEKAKTEISNLDFDIALIGCGGLGLILSSFIKRNIKKTSIYLGSGLFHYFGIKFTRQESKLKGDSYYNNPYSTYVFDEETPVNTHLLKNAYWKPKN